MTLVETDVFHRVPVEAMTFGQGVQDLENIRQLFRSAFVRGGHHLGDLRVKLGLKSEVILLIAQNCGTRIASLGPENLGHPVTDQLPGPTLLHYSLHSSGRWDQPISDRYASTHSVGTVSGMS